MKPKLYLQKIAHSYPNQPFYIQLLLTIFFYTLIFLVKVHSWYLENYKKLRRLISSLSSAFSLPSFLQGYIEIPLIRLPNIYNFITFPRLAFVQIVHKASKRRQQKIIRKQYRPSFLIAVRYKLKYAALGMIFSFLFIFLPLLVIIFLQDLPNPKELAMMQNPQTTKIYDRQGNILYQIYATQDRTDIPFSDVPKDLQNATLAIEDKNFYQHPGFDIASIIRALHEDASGGNFQGGSTITQQLIKSSMLTPEPSIIRKMKEIILAFWAERLYTKKQILEMYFNQVPYGGTAWGIEAAADVYFGKHTKDLDLAESAFLAGMTAAPTTYSPFGTDPKLWKIRQKEVLGRMIALGDISQKQAEDAEHEILDFKTQPTPLEAPHFVNYIKDILVKKYGLAMVEKGGLQVHTSLDLETQKAAEKIVSEEVRNANYLNLTNGAALITNPANGDILAMVGSHDFNDPNGGNVNVTTSLRQPGSSIKVVTYSAALSKGFTAASILDDSPVTFPDGINTYTPINYDGKFHGKIPLRIALANSFNIPAVKVLSQIGVSIMVNMGKQMGITSWGDPSQYGLSLTLGSGDVTMLDMATVYGTLANQGRRVDLNPILEITDAWGNTIEKKQNVSSLPVLDPGIAYILSDILADNTARSLEFGPASPLFIPGHFIPVKTGTSDNKRDNWTIGYTDKFVVTVWVGNNDNSPMSQTLASGITGAAPIWNRIMTELVKNTPEHRPQLPKDITSRLCFGHSEYFIRGTENKDGCSFPTPTQTNTYVAKPQ